MSAFKIKLSLLVLMLLPLLVWLGIWQISRYHQKLELEQIYKQRKGLPPLTMKELDQYNDLLYLPLTVSGHFNREHYFLLDNQIFKGRAGYSLIMPFETDENQIILVNRGWIASEARNILPASSVDDHNYQLTGTIYKPMGKSFLLKEDLWEKGWPKVIQAMDFDKASASLGKRLPAFFLNLNEQQPGALKVLKPKIAISSDKHMGYALQWFTMALVLMGLYLFQMKKEEK